MPAPTISIVTPSYNQAAFIGQTLESVANQDYSHVEHLVLDGGSTDGSVDVIRQHADGLAYWRSEKDNGQADAIAEGFQRSTGDIQGWLNSDDLLLPGALTAVARYFHDHPNVEVVSGGAYCVDTNGIPIQNRFGNFTLGVAATHDRLRYYDMDGVFQPATFWRRSAYEAVGGLDRSLQFIMDRDLFVRLAERRRFGRMKQMLACFRLHEDCKTIRIQDVRQREAERFRQRYGVNGISPLARRLLYSRYRVPDLARKLWLRTLEAGRAIELKKVG